jgi:hypothetical protein
MSNDQAIVAYLRFVFRYQTLLIIQIYDVYMFYNKNNIIYWINLLILLIFNILHFWFGYILAFV